MTYTAAERGPPSPGRGYTTYDSVAPRLHGVSTRQDAAKPSGAFDYDHPTSLVQLAGIASATAEATEVAWAGLASLAPRGAAANTAPKLRWTSWADYPKTKIGDNEYAQIGDRLYTHHAVDRMQPSGLGIPAGADGPGRSISPNFVEDVIRTGTPTDVIRDGVPRTIYTSGSVQVVTEDGGRIVVSVNPYSGGG